MSHGLPLKGEGDEKCLTLMNAVEETISRKLHACKAPSSKRKGLEGNFPLGESLFMDSGFFFYFFPFHIIPKRCRHDNYLPWFRH